MQPFIKPEVMAALYLDKLNMVACTWCVVRDGHFCPAATRITLLLPNSPKSQYDNTPKSIQEELCRNCRYSFDLNYCVNTEASVTQGISLLK